MDTVVFSLLGTQLDAGYNANRWDRWRPTVALCQQDDLLVHRLELLYPPRFKRLANVVAKDIALVSPETSIRLSEMDFTDPWDFEDVYGRLLDFVIDYSFDVDAETYLANLTTGTHVAQICWFLLTESRYVPGQLIQLSPQRNDRGDVRGSYQVIDLDLARYDQLARRFASFSQEGTSFLKSGIVTKNAAFNAMIDEIEKVVIRSTSPVLLLGPTGAGKSQLAHRIYALKRARHQVSGPLVEVNCATLRGDNAMSALFGHRKGAFTSAVSERGGLLRAADKGVLFLDEVGELGLDEQAMLLRAIENRRFLPVGSDEEQHSDFQLIAGTNRDLRAEAAAGRFRSDLLARIDLWTYELPALRDRLEDIPANVEFELARQMDASGNRVEFHADAKRAYLAFATGPAAAWRGNFRDLGASVTRMATLSERGRITLAIVNREIARLNEAWRPRTPGLVGGSGDAEESSTLVSKCLSPEDANALDPFDRIQLEGVLEVCQQSPSLSAAGRTLFATSRHAKRSNNDADRLRKYLLRFGLEWRTIATKTTIQ